MRMLNEQFKWLQVEFDDAIDKLRGTTDADAKYELLVKLGHLLKRAYAAT